MAEGGDELLSTECETEPCLETSNTENSSPFCAVCLQNCVYPTRLPCSHVFCFLCAKGLVSGGNTCALCRELIPSNYFLKPVLLETKNVPKKESDDEYQWFYEGKNGWWMYDDRSSLELENAFMLGESSYELLVCGTLYVVDFKANQQYRKSDPHRKRKIKRDLKSADKIGVAGLRKV